MDQNTQGQSSAGARQTRKLHAKCIPVVPSTASTSKQRKPDSLTMKRRLPSGENIETLNNKVQRVEMDVNPQSVPVLQLNSQTKRNYLRCIPTELLMPETKKKNLSNKSKRKPYIKNKPSSTQTCISTAQNPQQTSSQETSEPRGSIPMVDNNLHKNLPQNPLQKGFQQKLKPRGQFNCDFCYTHYKTFGGLNRHYISYHKMNMPSCKVGIPLVNLTDPEVAEKLTSLGIHNVIPLPGLQSNRLQLLAIPVTSVTNKSAISNLKALRASSLIMLGTLQPLPKM